jgi:predicted MFS family arabinose efflux permease
MMSVGGTTAAGTKAFTLLLALAFLTHLDLRILAPVLPAIAVSLHTTPGAVGLAMTSYALAFGAGQLVFGPLADRFGRVRVIRLAACGFGISAVVSATAMLTWQFIAARMLVGAFSGAVVPLTLAHIADTHPYEHRQRAIARVVIVNSVAFALSAAVGGVVSQVVSWRVMLIGIGVVALLPAQLLSQHVPSARGVVFVPRPRGFRSRYIEILQEPGAARVFALIFAEGFFIWGNLTYAGAFIHHRYGLNQLGTGGVLAVIGIGTMLTGMFLDTLRRYFSEDAVACAGGLAVAVGFVSMAPRTPLAVCICSLFLVGAGFIALVSALQVRATQLGGDTKATSMSMFALARYLGVATGTALLGQVFDAGLHQAMMCVSAGGLTIVAICVVRRPR